MSRSYKKPWIKDYQPLLKRIHSRRYRRFIRQDIKQWRNKYYLGGSYFPGCANCECLDEFWDNDSELLYWRSCLEDELEPSYPSRHRWINKLNICDWRMYYPHVDGRIKYLRK